MTKDNTYKKINIDTNYPCTSSCACNCKQNEFYSFNKIDGKDFKILQLTDIHYGAGFLSQATDKKALVAIEIIIKNAHPDLIICTGDSVYPIPIQSGTNNNLKAFKVLANFLEQFKIPYTFTFGNHDCESFAKYSKIEIANYLISMPHCIFTKGESRLSGVGNTCILLNNADGELNTAIMLLDSNMYTTSHCFSGYDNIHDDQIEWYKRTINNLSIDKNEPISSLAFFHIPCTEFRDAWDKFTDGDKEVTYHFGRIGESCDLICVPKFKGNFFEEMVNLGSLKGIFVGHDHYNNASYTYRGIRMTFGMSIDYLAYIDIKKRHSQRGGTLITISDDKSFDVKHIKLAEIATKND